VRRLQKSRAANRTVHNLNGKETQMTQKPDTTSPSLPTVQPSKAIDVRWTQFRTTDVQSDDYSIRECSEGLSPTDPLCVEIDELCRSFHPKAELKDFPAEPVFLHWHDESQNHLIFTKIKYERSAKGRRDRLNYLSLILPREESTETGSLWSILNEKAAFAAVENSITRKSQQVFLLAFAEAPHTESAVSIRLGLQETEKWDGAYTKQNAEELLDYLQNLSAEKSLPTFATWWRGGGVPPQDSFDIVLKCPEPLAISLETLIKKADDLRTRLASVLSGNSRSLYNDIDILGDAKAIADQARKLSQSHDRKGFTDIRSDLARNVNNLVQRLGEYQSASGEQTASSMATITGDYKSLAEEVPRILPPLRPGDGPPPSIPDPLDNGGMLGHLSAWIAPIRDYFASLQRRKAHEGENRQTNTGKRQSGRRRHKSFLRKAQGISSVILLACLAGWLSFSLVKYLIQKPWRHPFYSAADQTLSDDALAEIYLDKARAWIEKSDGELKIMVQNKQQLDSDRTGAFQRTSGNFQLTPEVTPALIARQIAEDRVTAAMLADAVRMNSILDKRMKVSHNPGHSFTFDPKETERILGKQTVDKVRDILKSLPVEPNNAGSSASAGASSQSQKP